MFTEQDLKQIKNLVMSFLKAKNYFPFVEDLEKYYSFFPKDLTIEEKKKLEEFINSIILEWLKAKNTKGASILLKIFERNKDLWREFRKLNNEENFDEEKFQKLGKQMENLVLKGEDQLTEKLIGSKSIGISKASNSWYTMIYAIFPLWNKIR